MYFKDDELVMTMEEHLDVQELIKKLNKLLPMYNNLLSNAHEYNYLTMSETSIYLHKTRTQEDIPLELSVFLLNPTPNLLMFLHINKQYMQFHMEFIDNKMHCKYLFEDIHIKHLTHYLYK